MEQDASPGFGRETVSVCEQCLSRWDRKEEIKSLLYDIGHLKAGISDDGFRVTVKLSL